MKFCYFREVFLAIACEIGFIRAANNLIDVQFSITNHKKCIVPDELNILTALSNISLQQCANECGNRLECQALNYHRRTKICYLLSQQTGDLVTNSVQTGPCVLVLKSDIKASCSCPIGEVCDGQFCDIKECQLETPKNAQIVGNLNDIGSRIFFNCSPGYAIIGEEYASCLPNGTWTYHSLCAPDCGLPVIVNRASVTFTSTTENSTAFYTCEAMYMHTSGDLEHTCGSDGIWHGISPTCKINCGTPVTVPDASRSFDATTEDAVVVYTCLPGYKITSGDLMHVCSSDGLWTGTSPICLKDCGTPTTVPDAYLSFSATTESAVVVYTCQSGYTMTFGDSMHTCTSDGVWNGILPICIIDCLEPPFVPSSVVTSGSTYIGDQRTYICDTGKYFYNGTDTLTTICQPDFQWSYMDVICPTTTGENYSECPGCGILRDCEDVKTLGAVQTGIYIIYPIVTSANALPVNVRCDMDTSFGGWTVIQRRFSNSDFYKTWTEYKNGFGTASENYWLGNENIAKLTSLGNYKIRFDLYDQNNFYRYAEYSTFSLSSESQGYKLTVGGYSGTAGDSYTSHSGMKFSTKDMDNDIATTSNCAVLYSGAWWYSDCHNSNLNGIYGSKDSGRGVNWATFTGIENSLLKTEIKIKRN